MKFLFKRWLNMKPWVRIYTLSCGVAPYELSWLLQLQMATPIVSVWLPHAKMPVPVARIPWMSSLSILSGSVVPMELLLEEILHQLIGSLSHYLQGFICFIHPRWCRISSINNMSVSPRVSSFEIDVICGPCLLRGCFLGHGVTCLPCRIGANLTELSDALTSDFGWLSCSKWFFIKIIPNYHP